MLISRFASQSTPFPSQSPQCVPPHWVLKGETLQSTAVHWPPVQLTLLQVTPQPPQLLSVSSGVSQPSVRLLLQSPQPWLQCTRLHVPVSHELTALSIAQGALHPPQLDGVLSAVS